MVLSSRATTFKTYHKLQGSQTGINAFTPSTLFKTYHKLQGSQTETFGVLANAKFKTYHKLQGSQTSVDNVGSDMCLRHIINYKVLKLPSLPFNVHAV